MSWLFISIEPSLLQYRGWWRALLAALDGTDAMDSAQWIRLKLRSNLALIKWNIRVVRG